MESRYLVVDSSFWKEPSPHMITGIRTTISKVIRGDLIYQCPNLNLRKTSESRSRLYKKVCLDVLAKHFSDNLTRFNETIDLSQQNIIYFSKDALLPCHVGILTPHCLEIGCRHSSKKFILSASHFANLDLDLRPLEGSLEFEKYFPRSNLI